MKKITLIIILFLIYNSFVLEIFIFMRISKFNKAPKLYDLVLQPSLEEIMWLYNSSVDVTYFGTRFVQGMYIFDNIDITGGQDSLLYSGRTIFQESPKLAYISFLNNVSVVLRNIHSKLNLTIWIYDFAEIIIQNSSLSQIHIQDFGSVEIKDNSSIEEIECKGNYNLIIENSTILSLYSYEFGNIFIQNSTIDKISVYDQSNLTISNYSQIHILEDGFYANSSLIIGNDQILIQNPITSDSIIGSISNTTNIDGTSNVISKVWSHIALLGSSTTKIENYSYNGSTPLNIRIFNQSKIELSNVTSKNNQTDIANGIIEAFDSSNIAIFENSIFGKICNYDNVTTNIEFSSINELFLNLRNSNNITIKNSAINLTSVSGKTHFISENSNIIELNYGIYCESGNILMKEGVLSGPYINTTEIINGNVSLFNLAFLDCYNSSIVDLQNLWNILQLNISTWDSSQLYITNCSAAFNITVNEGSICQIRDSSVYKIEGWQNSQIDIYNSNLTEAYAFYLINIYNGVGGFFTIMYSNIHITISAFRKYSSEFIEYSTYKTLEYNPWGGIIISEIQDYFKNLPEINLAENLLCILIPIDGFLGFILIFYLLFYLLFYRRKK